MIKRVYAIGFKPDIRIAGVKAAFQAFVNNVPSKSVIKNNNNSPVITPKPFTAEQEALFKRHFEEGMMHVLIISGEST